jgi:phosphoribosylformimino-5-aminoimidazole carboxamide ribotide isomerase
MDVVEKICRATGLAVEAGGGVRALDVVERYIGIGVARVILGSAAINDPALVHEAVAEYGDAIAVGIDAKGGRARTGGWLEDGHTGYLDLAAAVDSAGVSTIIYTDISKDGTLAGPNLAELSRIKAGVGADVIASGGVRDLGDIQDLIKLGVDGAICGKSVYEGTLDLAAAIRLGGAVEGKPCLQNV